MLPMTMSEGHDRLGAGEPGSTRARTDRPLPPYPRGRVRRMRTRRVRGTALLVAAVTLVLAAGCSNSGGAADASSVEKADLKVAVVPALDSAGFFIALYGGLFTAQGLHVTFVPATSSDGNARWG